MNVLLALSGGIASTTLLAHLLNINFNVATIAFSYKSTSNDKENTAAINIAKHYDVPITLIDIASPMAEFQMPVKIRNDNLKNLLFVSILAGIAESGEFDTIAIGTQNCAKALISSMNLSMKFAFEEEMKLYAPYIRKKKKDILENGINLKIPFEKIRSCSSSLNYACGNCLQCMERINLFEERIESDPITYD